MGLMDKANEFLNSEQGEQMTDQALQTGADAANKVTGGKFADQIAQGQAIADDKLGMPNAQQQAPDMTAGEQQITDAAAGEQL